MNECMPIAGMILGDRYRLVRCLDEGAFGRIFLAEHVNLGAPCVIKVLKYEHVEGGISRFVREACITSCIVHPNVVRTFDCGSDLPHGFVYLAMDYLDGDDLRGYIRKHGPLSVRETAKIARSFLAGLAAMHERSVVHRDLKAENIMVVSDGKGGKKAVIVDFGLAYCRDRDAEGNDGDRLTEPDLIMGTPRYMPGEQAVSSKPVYPAVDMYAVGVILFLMLTGDFPYERKEAENCLIYRTPLPEPPPLKRFRFDVPTRLEALMHRCMSHDPDARPTAGELRVLLKPFAHWIVEPEIVSSEASSIQELSVLAPYAPRVEADLMVQPMRLDEFVARVIAYAMLLLAAAMMICGIVAIIDGLVSTGESTHVAKRVSLTPLQLVEPRLECEDIPLMSSPEPSETLAVAH